MEPHLSDDEIERYLNENALASDQERVHGHMDVCPSCFATWREIISAHETLLGQRLHTPEHVTAEETLEQIEPEAVRSDANARTQMLRVAALVLAASLAVAIVRAFVVGDLHK